MTMIYWLQRNYRKDSNSADMHRSFRRFTVSTTKTSADYISEINSVSCFRPGSLPRLNCVLVRVLDAMEAICLLNCCYFRPPPWSPVPSMKMISGKKNVVFRFPTAKEHAAYPSLLTLLLIAHFWTRMSPDIRLFRLKGITALHYCPTLALLSLESKEKTKYIYSSQTIPPKAYCIHYFSSLFVLFAFLYFA